MSIASEFDSTIENIKSDYEGLENLGADLTNVNKNIQNIRTCLDNIYSSLPKTTGEGSNLSLSPTLKGKLNIEAYKGDTQQEGTPTPDSPQDINVVTGTQEVVVQNRNLLAGIELGEINSTTGEETPATGTVRSTNFMPYQLDTKYYASVNGAELSSGLNLRFYNKDKEYIGYSSSTLKGAMNFNIVITTSVVDTTPRYFKFRCPFNTGVITSINDKVLISTTNNYSYVAHQEQTKTLHLGDIELAKIGNYQDRIYKNNDKWYIEKNIGKYAINGASGTFSKPSTNRFNIDGALTDYLKANNTITCMSDKYVSYEQKPTDSDFNTLVANVNYGIELSSSNSAFTIRIKDTNYDDVNQFKTWLASNNVELLYVLSTPTYTEITNTTLLNELNELEKMMSYNGQTNISISGNLPMLLSVSALKGE